jgi:hypothetical protein
MDDQSLDNQNSQVQQQAQPVVEPVSTGQKEQGPAISTPRASEYLAPSEVTPEIAQEAKEFGVEEVSEKDPFKDISQAGVKPAGPFVEPKTEPEGKVKLPLTEEEVQVVEKKESPSSSIKWLASLIKKAWKKIKGAE